MSEWSMKINLKGVNAAGSVGTRKILENGHYIMTVTDTVYQSHNGQVRFNLVVAEGEFTGCKAAKWMRIAKDLSDSIIYYWKAVARSCGYSEQECDSIESWSSSHFSNRRAYIRYTKGDKEKNIYPNVEFLTPEVWEASKGAAEPPSVQKPVETQKSSAPMPPTPEGGFGHIVKDANNFVLDDNDFPF
jgi:hypothetical protein